MRVALWITVAGSTVLFGSIAGLVLLMYLLTAPWLFPKDERASLRARRLLRKRKGLFRRRTDRVEGEIDEAEHERRLRAVALATAIACAETSEVAQVPALPLLSDWRLLHRASQFTRLRARRRGRP